MEKRSVSTQTLLRLPLYLNYLRSLPKGKSENISATAIADALRLGDVQVRKDLALVSSGGRPKVGYVTRELTSDIENFLGYHDVETAVLVGAGDLGHSLLSYDGFSGYGLEIAAAFDRDPALVGTTIAGKRVLSMEKLVDLCCRMQIHMGIIAVPGGEAQAVCDTLVSSGVLAIWNFAPVRLDVPEDVLVTMKTLPVLWRSWRNGWLNESTENHKQGESI